MRTRGKEFKNGERNIKEEEQWQAVMIFFFLPPLKLEISVLLPHLFLFLFLFLFFLSFFFFFKILLMKDGEREKHRQKHR